MRRTCFGCGDKATPRAPWVPFCSQRCAAQYALSDLSAYSWCRKCESWQEPHGCDAGADDAGADQST